MNEQRIALLIPNLACGGAERVMLTLAKGFLQRGYQVDLLLLRAEGELMDSVPEKVNVMAFGKRKPRQIIFPLAAWLRVHRPAVLLSSLSQLAWVASIACRLSRTATRCFYREESTLSKVLDTMNPLHAWLRLWLLRHFCAGRPFICPSQQAAQDMAQNLGGAVPQIRMIPNPIIDSDFFLRVRKEVVHPWFASGNYKVILAVGRLHHAKGFDILLEAFAQVLVRRKDVRLLILGEGDERSALEQQRHRLGLDGVVEMPGYVSNPLPYMAKADVFVLSSRWEGLSSVLIEALACGARVVATDCPSGSREILEHGRYGRLVPPENPTALANALVTALDAETPQVSPEWIERYCEDQAVARHLEVMGLPEFAGGGCEDR